ncbi:hypothetical protein OIV19_19010 [Brucella sp. HL-2]|nr:hypothetical protein [Brucella sp. HL-2]MCV9909694.1 hypothetical protein [Brucella sp. HL-2]
MRKLIVVASIVGALCGLSTQFASAKSTVRVYFPHASAYECDADEKMVTLDGHHCCMNKDMKITSCFD